MTNQFSLTAVLDRFIEDMAKQAAAERKEKYGARDHFFISETGSCPRKIAYSFYGLEEEETDARGQRVFQNGEYTQLRYEQYLRMLGVFVARECHWSTENYDEIPVNATGRSDIIVDFARLQAIYNVYFMGADESTIPDPLVEMESIELEPGFFYYRPKRYLTAEEVMALEAANPGRLGVVEMKTINTYGFAEVLKSGMAKPDHHGQLSWYEVLSGIQHGWVLYEDKNDQKATDFYVERDERTVFGSGDGRSMGYSQEFHMIAEHIENGTVPPRIEGAHAERFPCAWKSGRCKFYEHCWNPEHNGEWIPNQQQAQAQEADAAEESEEVTLEEVKSWLDEGLVGWVKLIDANGNGNVVQASMPKPLRDQMLDFLFPNAVEVDWEGSDGGTADPDLDELYAPGSPGNEGSIDEVMGNEMNWDNDPNAEAVEAEPEPQLYRVVYLDLTTNRPRPPRIEEEVTYEEFYALAAEHEAGNIQIVEWPKFDEKAEEKGIDVATDALKPEGYRDAQGNAIEFTNADGVKYIFCAQCPHPDPIEYKRLGNGGTVKCPACGHKNKVVRLETVN